MIAEMVMDIIRARRKRRIKKAVDKAITEARAEAIAWNRRRLDAEARGEPFDEPFPYSGGEHDATPKGDNMPESTPENGGKPRAEIVQVIEEFGGVAALVERMDEHERLNALMQKEIESLPETTDDRWVAMGRDGVLETGNSLEEALSKVEAKGLADGTVIVEFLSAEPEVLIL